MRTMRVMTVLALTALTAGQVSAATNTWIKLVSGNGSGAWGTSDNWSGSVPDATDDVADFSTLNITANAWVTNETPRVVGGLVFGDTTASHDWSLTNSTLSLETSLGTPVITVSNRTATLFTGLLGSQGFLKNGQGTLTLSGGTNNTFSGPITVDAGTLFVSGGKSLKNTSGSITVSSGALLTVNGKGEGAVTNALYLNGSGLTVYGNAGLSGPITLLSDATIAHDVTVNISGTITATGAGKNLTLRQGSDSGFGTTFSTINLGTGILTIQGAGPTTKTAFTHALNGPNTYSGGTVITNYGMAYIGGGVTLGSGGLTIHSGYLDLKYNSMTIPWLEGTGGLIFDSYGAAGQSQLTVNQSMDTTYSGVISNGPVRALKLTKTGVGALTLDGANTYTGATTVAEGTLGVGGALGLSAVTVNTGAAFGAGSTGVVGRAVLGGSLTFQNNSSLLVDLQGDSVDAVIVNGNVSVVSGTVNVVLSGNRGGAGSWKILESASGTLSGNYALAGGGVQGVLLSKTATALWVTVPPAGTLIHIF